MDNLEQQIGSILGNPELMQKIMTMAQSLSGSAPASAPAAPPAPDPEPLKNNPPPAPPAPLMPEMDLRMIQTIAGFAQQGNIDPNQRALLKALEPYLSRERISKLEKAMRAAKIAQIASSVLGQRGQPFHTGR